MLWLIALALSGQQLSAEETLTRIEQKIQTAHSIKVKIRREGSISDGSKTRVKASSTILLNREKKWLWRVTADYRTQEDTHSLEVTAVYDGDTIMVRIEPKQKSLEKLRKTLKVPKTLIGGIGPAIVRADITTALSSIFTHGAPGINPSTVKHIKEDLRHTLHISSCKHGPDDAGAKTLLYTLSLDDGKRTFTNKLWYDPQTLALLKRTVSGRFASPRRAVGDGTFTDTYEEYSFDVEIPQDAFRLPEIDTQTPTEIDKGQPPQNPTKASVIYHPGHHPAVNCLALSPDGRFVASGDDEGNIVLWNVTDFSVVKRFTNGGGIVSSLAFNETGSMLYATGSGYDVVEILVKDGSRRNLHVGALGSIGLVSPIENDSKLLVYTAHNRVLLADLPSRAKGTLDRNNMLKVLKKYSVFGGFTRHVVLSCNGRFLAVTSQNEINNRSAPPQKLTIIDTRSFRTSTFELPTSESYFSSTICFSSDSKSLWLYQAREVLHTYRLQEASGEWKVERQGIGLPAWRGSASCMTGDDLPLYISSPKGTVRYWDGSGGRLRTLVTLELGKKPRLAREGIEELLWIPKRKRLVAALWDGRIAEIAIPDCLPNK